MIDIIDDYKMYNTIDIIDDYNSMSYVQVYFEWPDLLDMSLSVI